MSPFFSQSAWLCLTATAVLGGMLFYRSKSPGKLWNQVLCLAGLWGGACLLNLSLLWSLLLLSLSCFFLCVCSSDQEFLPVDQKAVLVTGKWSALLWLSLGAGSDTLPRWDVVRFGLNVKYLIVNDRQHTPKWFSLGFFFFSRCPFIWKCLGSRWW